LLPSPACVTATKKYLSSAVFPASRASTGFHSASALVLPDQLRHGLVNLRARSSSIYPECYPGPSSSVSSLQAKESFSASPTSPFSALCPSPSNHCGPPQFYRQQSAPLPPRAMRRKKYPRVFPGQRLSGGPGGLYESNAFATPPRGLCYPPVWVGFSYAV
jgi:hypothetical protein